MRPGVEVWSWNLVRACMLLKVGCPVISVPPNSLFFAMLYMIWKGGRPKIVSISVAKMFMRTRTHTSQVEIDMTVHAFTDRLQNMRTIMSHVSSLGWGRKLGRWPRNPIDFVRRPISDDYTRALRVSDLPTEKVSKLSGIKGRLSHTSRISYNPLFVTRR